MSRSDEKNRALGRRQEQQLGQPQSIEVLVARMVEQRMAEAMAEIRRLQQALTQNNNAVSAQSVNATGDVKADGAVQAAQLTTTGNAAVGGDLAVTGAITANSVSAGGGSLAQGTTTARGTWEGATDAEALARTAVDRVVTPGNLAAIQRHYLEYRDEKAAGTEGGTFTSGAWQTRTINTEVADTGGHGALASNEITLDAGTYECEILCPAHMVGLHKARLYNVTDASVMLVGTVGKSNRTYPSYSHSIIVGRFTLASAKAVRIEHRAANTQDINGFGEAAGFSTEIYTVARFWWEP